MAVATSDCNHTWQSIGDTQLSKIIAAPHDDAAVGLQGDGEVAATGHGDNVALGCDRYIGFAVVAFTPGIDPAIDSQCEGCGHTCPDIFEAHVFECGWNGCLAVAIIAPSDQGIVLE